MKRVREYTIYAEKRLKAEFAREVIEKTVTPRERRVIAKQLKAGQPFSIHLCCAVVGISEACYHYQPKLNEKNDEIADWLIRLAQTHKR